MIASMQPLRTRPTTVATPRRTSAQAACRTSCAFKDLLDAGAVLVFGSDWPVVSLNPWLGIDAAVTGRLLDSDERWMTHQNITVGEALLAATPAARGLWAAGGGRDRQDRGWLPGRLCGALRVAVRPGGGPAL
ncbi:MAG: amidohydrolase family protein [Phycisphaerales bacterium]